MSNDNLEITKTRNPGRPKGPCPAVWKYSREEAKQRKAYARMKAQAKYRMQSFELTFEEFIQLWTGKWEQRGKGRDELSLSRIDWHKGWSVDNCHLVTRNDLLVREAEVRVALNILRKQALDDLS